MEKILDEKRPYFEIGAWYQYQWDGTICKMIDNEKCEADDGQESCAICKGRIIFEKLDGTKFVKCPYTFNPNNIQWVPYFTKIEDAK
jgi:hypothetical protein